MAATIPEYVVPLLLKQQELAGLLGTDVMHADFQTYRINLTLLAYVGVLMQALNAKGVVTDAEWLTALADIPDGTWPEWLLNQTAPPA